MRFTYPLLLILSCLTACSPSSKDSQADVSPNQTPTVTVDDVTAKEKSTLTIQSTANDSDGNIANYQWQQTGGTNVEMTASGSSLDLTLPDVSEITELTFSVTVTDNRGATASTAFVVTVEPIVVSVALTGEVTSSRFSFPNTEVQLSVGSQSWLSSTNELGAYRFEVELDDDATSEMMTIVTNPNNSSINKLVSVLPPLETLVDVTQPNAIVDSFSTPNVNVSTLTTARYILANTRREEAIASYEDYVERYDDWEPEFAFDVVTFVDVIANEVYFEDFNEEPLSALPSEFTSAYQYLDNYEILEYLVDLVKDLNSYAWENSVEKFASEANLMYSSSDLETINVSGRFGKVTLKDNGSGSLNSIYKSDFTWTLDNGALVLDLWSQDYPVYKGNGYDWLNSVETLTFTPIYRTARGTYTYCEQEYRVWNSSNGYEGLYTSISPVVNSMPLDKIVEENTKWYLSFADANSDDFELPDESRLGWIDGELKEVTFEPTPVTEGVYNIEIKHFGFDGGEKPTFNTYTAQATIVDDQIQFEYHDYLVNLAFLRNNEGDLYDIFADVENLSSIDDSEWSYGSAQTYKSPVSLRASDITGKKFVLSNTGISSHTWLEFNNDGTFVLFLADDLDNDGVIGTDAIDDWDIWASVGLWTIEDGKIKVIRHRKDSLGYTCLNGVWSPTLEDECKAFSEQVYTPVFDVSAENSGYIIRESTYYFDYRLDQIAYPNEAAFIPYFYNYFLREYVIQDTRPVQLPEDVLELLANRG